MVAERTKLTGHYEWDKLAGKFVRVGLKPVRHVGDHNDMNAPFEAQVRAGIRRQADRGGKFAHAAKKLKSTWGF